MTIQSSASDLSGSLVTIRAYRLGSFARARELLRPELGEAAPMSNSPFFYVYRDRAGEWRWRLRAAGNHEIIADSAEGYGSQRGAEEGAERVQRDAPKALIVSQGS